MSDEFLTLIERCLAGQQPAMIDLVDQYRNRVFAFCLRMLGHRQDAEDAAQETFVRALRYLSRWDSTRDFDPWLLAIAGNRCRTMLASRCRRPQSVQLVEAACDQSTLLDSAKSLAEEVSLALENLRLEYRQAFILYHENELSYKEISEAMSRPLGTVKTWVYRARRELIDRLVRRGACEDLRHALPRV